MAPPPRILVLDLGDVLFHYDTTGLDKFSTGTLRAVITSPEWEALERGEVGEQQALHCLSSKADIAVCPSVLRAGLDQCRGTLHVDSELLQSLTAIKNKMNNVGGGLKVYAMTNVSKQDFALMQDVLTKQGFNWDLFDGVFTSFEAGMRKPEARFFEHVVDRIGFLPKDMVFVDDKVENVNAALALGMHGIVFKNRAELTCQLHQFLLDARTVAGKAWLKANSRDLNNRIENGPNFYDTFSQFLLMEATNDRSLLHLDPNLDPDQETDEDIQRVTRTARQWNYFLGQPVGTTAQFPKDVDTTAYSLLGFTPSENVDTVLDAMLENRNADGLVQTYWDPTRPRTDICVLTNVVRVFYKYNRGHEIQESLTFISKALRDGTYFSGTRHYCTSETFLFYFAHLVAKSPQAPEIQALREPLIKAIGERVGVFNNIATQGELDLEPDSRAKGEAYTAYVPEVDSLALAMRILACQLLQIRPPGFELDMARLTEMQCADGSWPLGWVCRYGRTKLRIGNHGIVTAFAVSAIDTEAKGAANVAVD